MKQLSIEQARELYALGGKAAEIAVELFPELAERKLPKTWEEYVLPASYKYSEIGVPVEYDDAFDALVKLLLLKQEYNGDWVADWEDETQIKHSILLKRSNQLSLISRYHVRTFLAFKTAELRNQFAANFKELIEAAKPLLG